MEALWPPHHPPSPHFHILPTTLQCSAADIVCGPEFHISGICLRRRYTQAYLPAQCPQRHPSLVKKCLLLRNISKEASSVARFATLFNSSWLKGLTYCLLHNFHSSSAFFAFPHIFQSSCSLIRSQISTVRKK